MTNLIKNNIDKIADACEKYNVKSLYLFGSAARGNDFSEKSDIDLLVNFKQLPVVSDEDVFRKVTNYESLFSTLESILNRKIDLVQEENIRNRFLRYFINKEKKLLYGLS